MPPWEFNINTHYHQFCYLFSSKQQHTDHQQRVKRKRRSTRKRLFITFGPSKRNKHSNKARSAYDIQQTEALLIFDTQQTVGGTIDIRYSTVGGAINSRGIQPMAVWNIGRRVKQLTWKRCGSQSLNCVYNYQIPTGYFIWKNRIWTDGLEIHPSHWDEDNLFYVDLDYLANNHNWGTYFSAWIRDTRYGHYPILNELSKTWLIFDTQQQSCGWKRWTDPLDTQGIIGDSIDCRRLPQPPMDSFSPTTDVFVMAYSIIFRSEALNTWRRHQLSIINNAARGGGFL